MAVIIRFLAALFIVSMLLSQCTTPQKGNDMEQPNIAIHHHVFFWLKEPGNEAHIAQLKAGLQSLRDIPQVKQLWTGVPASTEKREVVDNSWDVSELMFFSSVEDQDAYQIHPLHKAFVEQYSHLWDKVVVYDVKVDQ